MHTAVLGVILLSSVVRGQTVGFFRQYWHYIDHNSSGPSDWGSMRIENEQSAAYPMCAGDSQSPVDFSGLLSTPNLKPLVLDYQPTSNLALIHSLVSLRISGFEGFGSVYDLNTDRRYEAVSMEIHMPSEHTIGGGHFDAELQIIHKLSGALEPRERLIISLFVTTTTSSHNTWFDEIVAAFPALGSPGTWSNYVNPSFPYNEQSLSLSLERSLSAGDLIPQGGSFFAYNGSTTMPPCSPATWFVYRDPVRMSAEQLRQFSNELDLNGMWAAANGTRAQGFAVPLFEGFFGNRRPVQARNGRRLSYHPGASSRSRRTDNDEKAEDMALAGLIISCISLCAFLVLAAGFVVMSSGGFSNRELRGGDEDEEELEATRDASPDDVQ